MTRFYSQCSVFVFASLLFVPPAFAAAFVDNPHAGTVTDLATGLMWDKCSWGQTWDSGSANTCSVDYTATTHNWEAALGVAVAANGAKHRGYDDWRLPSRTELESLPDPSRWMPAIDTGFFPNTPSNWFWTSDTSIPHFAWGVAFGDGRTYMYGKINAGRVRLVRDDQFFTAPSGHYNDGTVFCELPGCAAYDGEDGTRTVEVGGPLDSDGKTVDIRITHHPDGSGGGIVHELIVRDAQGGELFATGAGSALPGSTVTIGEDDQGQLQVTTRAELPDGTVVGVVARADGSALHRITTPGGAITRALSEIPGASTTIDEEGRIVMILADSECERRIRSLVETFADGEGLTRYEGFDEVLVRWVPLSRTIDDTVSRFESGHSVQISGSSCAPLLRVETPVTNDLYF